MIEVATPQHPNWPRQLQAAVLDWAGTTVDFGSRAPVQAVMAAFAQAGVPVTEEEARRPMGRAKRDHLQAVLDQPQVARRWMETHQRPATDADLDQIYDQFLTMQIECITECSGVIDGCPAAIEACRALGLKIGSSTGYTRDLLARVAQRAAGEGYTPDVMLSADDVSPGRPAPWLCLENARRLAVYPMAAVVKVDDTPAGVTAGRNAGAWSVGVVASGNEVGLAPADLEALPSGERAERLERARERLIAAGAHLLIDTIAELPAAVTRINERLARGESP